MEPKRVTTKNFRQFIEHLRWLVTLNEASGSLDSVPEAKQQRFASEAYSLNLSEINATEEKKRWTLAVALIHRQTASAIDDLTEMFLRSVSKLHRRAQEALEQYLKGHQQKTESLIEILKSLLDVWNPEQGATSQVQVLDDIIGNQAKTLVEQCAAYLGFAKNNYLPFLPRFYRSYRRNLFSFLQLLSPKTTSSDTTLEDAIGFLLENADRRGKQLSLKIPSPDSNEEKTLDLSWIPNKWWKTVTGTPHRQSEVQQVDRRFFEICLFSQVWLELKSGDLYIEGSEKFSDYRNQLVSDEEFKSQIESYCQMMDYPTDAGEFVKTQKRLLTRTVVDVNATFPENESVSIKDGEPIIRQLTKRKKAKGFAQVEQLIAARMPECEILDVLSDTEHWMNWTKHFNPISGYEPRLDSPQQRYIATAFCYGCNLGPTQAARCLSDLSRRQISYVNLRHVDEQKLLEANVSVINEYNKFLLPTFWGSGKSASADGTKWDVYEQNLLSEYHIRYGGWGGIGYYHVSDTYIALFSRFISCGVWEAVHILDGLLENRSEIRPDTLHADTQGQSEPVFGKPANSEASLASLPGSPTFWEST